MTKAKLYSLIKARVFFYSNFRHCKTFFWLNVIASAAEHEQKMPMQIPYFIARIFK